MRTIKFFISLLTLCFTVSLQADDCPQPQIQALSMQTVEFCPVPCSITGAYEFFNLSTDFDCSLEQVDNCLEFTSLPGFFGLLNVTGQICNELDECDNFSTWIEVVDGLDYPDCLSNQVFVFPAGQPFEFCPWFCNMPEEFELLDIHLMDPESGESSEGLVTNCISYAPAPGYENAIAEVTAMAVDPTTTNAETYYFQLVPELDCENPVQQESVNLLEPRTIDFSFCKLQSLGLIPDDVIVSSNAGNIAFTQDINTITYLATDPEVITDELFILGVYQDQLLDTVLVQIDILPGYYPNECTNPIEDHYVLPMTPLEICPDFCNLSGWNIVSIVSNFHETVSWDAGGSCFTYISLPGFSGTQTLSVIVEDPAGYTDYVTVNVHVGEDLACLGDECVWPGDSNNDGTVNNFDVLNIGYNFSRQGPLRFYDSGVWEGVYAADWTAPDILAVNAKHSDCNGDGTITDLDLVPIDINYGSQTGKTGETSGESAFSLQLEESLIQEGDTVHVEVFLSEDAAQDDVYGFAYSISFNPEYVEEGSVEFSFEDSDFGETERLDFSKVLSGRVDIASVLTDHSSISFGGKVGDMSFVVIDNINGKQATAEMDLDLFSAAVMRGSGQLSPIEGEKTTLTLEEASSLPTPELAQVQVYPNPISEYLIIDSPNTELTSLRLIDMGGRLITEQVLSQIGPARIDLQDIPTGIYIVEIISGSQRRQQKIVKH